MPKRVMCVTTLLSLAVFVAPASRADLTVTADGKSDYRIVVPDHSTPPVDYAAGELQTFLQKISGVTLPIVTESKAGNGPGIVIGPTRSSEALIPAAALASLKRDGVLIKTSGKNLFLRGGNDRGQIYCVYSLLEDYLGVKFLAADCTVIPPQKNITLPEIDYSYAPIFFYRNAMDHFAYFKDLSLHHRLNGSESPLDNTVGGKLDVPPCHNFLTWVSPETYSKEHPEYFSLHGGKRNCAGWPGGGQLCLTNPEVLKITTRNVMKWLDEHPAAAIVDVSQMDTNGDHEGCECENCRAVLKEEGSESGALLRFINGIAEAVARKYPDRWVSTLAYQYTAKPPNITKPANNVIIRLCHTGCYYHGLECQAAGATISNYPVKFTMRNDLDGWSKITPNIFVWHYAVNFCHFPAPTPNLASLAKDIRYYRSHGVPGVMTQGDYLSPGGDLAPLRQYLISQLLWNPDRDPLKIREEFCNGYYGPAAAEVLAFLDLMDTEARNSKAHVFAQWEPDLSLSGEFVRDGLNILEPARKKADTPALANRIDLLLFPLWYMQLSYPARFGAPDQAPELLKTIKTLIQKNHITTFNEGRNSVNNWLNRMDKMYPPATVSAPPVPASNGQNPACVPAQRDDWSADLCQQLTQQAQDEHHATVPVMFLGDSITQLWTFSRQEKNPGGLDSWNKYFKPMGAVNFGITGDRTEHLLQRITAGGQLKLQPQLIVLLIGTNNLHREPIPDSADQIVAGVKLIVNTIRKVSPKTRILLLGILPRTWGGDEVMQKIKAINPRLAGLADNQTVFYLDAGPSLLDKNGAITTEIFRDGLHLSPRGYEVFAETILPKLATIQGRP